MADVWIDETGLENLFHDPAGPVAVIMERAAYRVEGAAKTLLLAPGTGIEWPAFVRTRLRGVPRGTPGRLSMWGGPSGHVSAAPGDAPSSDTGLLLASIGHEMTDTPDGVGAYVGSPMQVALWQELGTRYMDPHPFLRPALDIGLA